MNDPARISISRLPMSRPDTRSICEVWRMFSRLVRRDPPCPSPSADAPSNCAPCPPVPPPMGRPRSEEHTSELQSLMRNSYAVFSLKKKKKKQRQKLTHNNMEKAKQPP